MTEVTQTEVTQTEVTQTEVATPGAPFEKGVRLKYDTIIMQ